MNAMLIVGRDFDVSFRYLRTKVIGSIYPNGLTYLAKLNVKTIDEPNPITLTLKMIIMPFWKILLIFDKLMSNEG